MQLGLHAQSIDRRQLKKQRLARSQSRNANIQMWLGAWCKGTGKPLIKSQWILFLRGFPPDVVNGFPSFPSFCLQFSNSGFPLLSTNTFPLFSTKSFPPGCVHGFPPKIMLHDVPPFFFRAFDKVFPWFSTNAFPWFSSVVFQQLHFRSLPRNLNTLKWLGSVCNSLPHRITHRIPHKFPPRYFISPVSHNKGPLMVVINCYKEHIAVINPLIHIASVPPHCASHFWSFQQLFWNISVSRGSFPSESGRWRKTPAISSQVIPPIGKFSPERRQAARMSHPGNST